MAPIDPEAPKIPKIKGRALRRSKFEISARAKVGTEDINSAAAFFRRAAPPQYKGLLNRNK